MIGAEKLVFPKHSGIHVLSVPLKIFPETPFITMVCQYRIEYDETAAHLIIGLWNMCLGRRRQFLFTDPNSGKTVWAYFDGDELQNRAKEAGETTVVTLADYVEE